MSLPKQVFHRVPFVRHGLAGLMFLLGGLVLSGSPVAVYTFDEGVPPSALVDGLSAQPIEAGEGASLPRGHSALAQSNQSLLFRDAGFHHLNKADAIQNDAYLKFSLEVEAGHQLGLTGVRFYTLRRPEEGAGAPSAFALYLRSDGVVTHLGSGTVEAAEEETSRDFRAHQVDLEERPELSGLEGAVDFFLYLWTPQGNRTEDERAIRLDEFTFFGEVATVGDESGQP